MRILLTRSLGAHYEFKRFTFVFIIHTTTVNRILSPASATATMFKRSWSLLSIFFENSCVDFTRPKPASCAPEWRDEDASHRGDFLMPHIEARFFFSNEIIKSEHSRYLLSVFARRALCDPFDWTSISNCQSQAGFSRKQVKQSFINFFFLSVSYCKREFEFEEYQTVVVGWGNCFLSWRKQLAAKKNHQISHISHPMAVSLSQMLRSDILSPFTSDTNTQSVSRRDLWIWI